MVIMCLDDKCPKTVSRTPSCVNSQLSWILSESWPMFRTTDCTLFYWHEEFSGGWILHFSPCLHPAFSSFSSSLSSSSSSHMYPVHFLIYHFLCTSFLLFFLPSFFYLLLSFLSSPSYSSTTPPSSPPRSAHLLLFIICSYSSLSHSFTFLPWLLFFLFCFCFPLWSRPVSFLFPVSVTGWWWWRWEWCRALNCLLSQFIISSSVVFMCPFCMIR